MDDLVDAQRLLQAEADAVVSELKLLDMLGPLGRPVRVGSSAMGLMVRRDIDITIICPRLDEATLEAFVEVGGRLMQNAERVEAVRFRNDSGFWNKEPEKYPDGFYLGVTARARDSQVWTLDLWAIDQPDRQPDLTHLKTLWPRITDAHRRTILQIKQALADRPDRPASTLVYEAVMDHGIQTIEQFDAWRPARRA